MAKGLRGNPNHRLHTWGRQEKRLSQWGDSCVQGSSLGRAVTRGSWAGILGEGGRQLLTASWVA